MFCKTSTSASHGGTAVVTTFCTLDAITTFGEVRNTTSLAECISVLVLTLLTLLPLLTLLTLPLFSLTLLTLLALPLLALPVVVVPVAAMMRVAAVTLGAAQLFESLQVFEFAYTLLVLPLSMLQLPADVLEMSFLLFQLPAPFAKFRSLVVRGRAKLCGRDARQKRALEFVVRQGDNGIVWHILSFWRATA